MTDVKTGLTRRDFIATSAAAVGAAAVGLGVNSAQAADTLKVGFISPRTGPLGGFGEGDGYILDLARKAFEEMALDESVTAEDVSLGVQATLELAQAAQVAAQVRAQVELAKPEETPAAEPALAEAA